MLIERRSIRNLAEFMEDGQVPSVMQNTSFAEDESTWLLLVEYEFLLESQLLVLNE